MCGRTKRKRRSRHHGAERKRERRQKEKDKERGRASERTTLPRHQPSLQADSYFKSLKSTPAPAQRLHYGTTVAFKIACQCVCHRATVTLNIACHPVCHGSTVSFNIASFRVCLHGLSRSISSAIAFVFALLLRSANRPIPLVPVLYLGLF